MERKRIVDQIVCSFLYYKQSHGYEIYEILNSNNVEKFMDFSKATIYNSLKRLEKNEMLQSSVVENENKPPKTVYTLNKVGKEYLIELVEESLSSCKFETIFAANLGYHFHHLLDFDTLISILKNRLDEYRKLEKHIEPKYHMSKQLDIFHMEVIMESNLTHIKAEIKKVERVVEKYQTDPGYLKSNDERVKKFMKYLFNTDTKV